MEGSGWPALGQLAMATEAAWCRGIGVKLGSEKFPEEVKPTRQAKILVVQCEAVLLSVMRWNVKETAEDCMKAHL